MISMAYSVASPGAFRGVPQSSSQTTSPRRMKTPAALFETASNGAANHTLPN
jgi:hypothetical protein